MEEIEDIIYTEILELCQEGEKLADEGNYKSSLIKYWKAFDLVPEPKTDWEASTWILAAIGDAHFFLKEFQAGLEIFNQILFCPDGPGNPFVHLRLGQCYFELGFYDNAANGLTRAYALMGEELFEEQDPKYYEFLKTKIIV